MGRERERERRHVRQHLRSFVSSSSSSREENYETEKDFLSSHISHFYYFFVFCFFVFFYFTFQLFFCFLFFCFFSKKVPVLQLLSFFFFFFFSLSFNNPKRKREMASSSGASSNSTFDHLFKILLVGDSGVGKSSVLLRFTQNEFEDMSPTIGVDFKLKMMNVEDKRLKLTIWDTAGQERFRTLTSSYYRGAHGIIFVYDVTRPDSFRGVEEIWMNEVESYSTLDAIKIVIGNKVDKEDTRKVTREEGKSFARRHGCLFLETSAKTSQGVEQVFQELLQKILETPHLVEDHNAPKAGINFREQQEKDNGSSCC